MVFMKNQKIEFSLKRCAAMLLAFVFIVASVMTGCGKKKQQSESADVTQANAGQESQMVSLVSSNTYTHDATENTAGKTSAFVASDGSSNGSSGGSSNGSSSGGSYSGGSSSGGSYSGGGSSSSSNGSSSGNSSSGNSTSSKTKAPTSESVYNDVAVQRKFGFNAGYDAFTGVVGFNIDEITTYFTYGGKDWLLEFWKGEYEVVTLGGEIGIYDHVNKTGKAPSNPKLIHYKAVEDSDALYMTMELWQCDSKGDRKILSRPRLKCWWLAAFEPGTLEKHSRRTDLVLLGSVQFKNKEMMDAFEAKKKKKAFTKVSSKPSYKNSDTYFLDRSSSTLYFNWKNAKN